MTGKTISVQFSLTQMIQVVQAIRNERDRYRGWAADPELTVDMRQTARDGANRLDTIQAYLLGACTAAGETYPEPVDAEADEAD